VHDLLNGLLPGRRLDEVARLGGSDRSDVRRFADRDSGGTLIAKLYTAAGESWVREVSALSVLPADIPAPRLVASGGEPPIVVMTDVGTGGSVADALLGADPDEAARAVGEWAEAVAGLHSATAGLRAAFTAEVDSRAGDLPVDPAPMATELAGAFSSALGRCAELGVPVPDAARDELQAIGAILSDDDGAAALTPSDTCPDNNVRADGGLRLIDFEGAQWRHIAWDAAYLRVPWPSCWCAWRMPDAVADAALRAYRARSAIAVTDEQIAVATLGWAFVGVAWFAARALADDPPLAGDRPVPTRRAMIMHRLGVAERLDVLPAAAALAGALRRALHARWGEVELAYAPAFQDGVPRV
jgi:hypothetical protein